MDRRNFFQLAAGTALVAFQNNAVERAAAATRSISDKSPQEVAADEDYWARNSQRLLGGPQYHQSQQRTCQSRAARGAGCPAPLPGIQRYGAGAHHDQ